MDSGCGAVAPNVGATPKGTISPACGDAMRNVEDRVTFVSDTDDIGELEDVCGCWPTHKDTGYSQ